MNFLIVRAVEDARRTSVRLEAEGHRAIVSPALEIRSLGATIPDGPFDAVLASSAHAFEADIPPRLKEAPIFVVGPRTAEAAAEAGFTAPALVAKSAVDLVPLLGQRFSDRSRLVYLAGRDRKPELEKALSPRHELCVVETYAAEPAQRFSEEARRALSQGRIDVVLHYSRRSADIFLALAAAAGLDGALPKARHVAISSDCATPLIAAGLRPLVAEKPNEDGMLATLN